jgi:glycerol-3-phosphate acyltransferase PlsY
MSGIPALLCVFSFLLGTIPFGLIISKLLGIDNLREKGSGNIGATNVSRVAGFWPGGFFTFLFDLLKGTVPVGIAAYTTVPQLLSESGLGAWNYPVGLTLVFPIWCIGLCAVIGHCFSPWLHFRGGKGVATGFGVWVLLSPVSAAAGVLAFGLAFFFTRTVSIASLTGSLLALVALLVISPIGSYVWPAAAIAFLILLRHEKNIDALLGDRENSF